MKAEDSQSTPAPTPTPAPATPQPPAQTYTTTWSSMISPARTALQQQAGQHPTASPYYQAYASHYPQAAYAAFQYPPAQSQVQQQAGVTPMARPAPTYQTSTYSLNTQTPTTTTPNVAAPTTAATTTANNSGMDTADIATLNDALGSAGVDLRAEEESLQRTNDSHQSYRSYEDRTRKQPPKPAFDVAILGATMRSVGTQHKVSRVPDESVNYLALALRARLQDLITSMVAAAKHRTDTQFDRPASLYEEDGQPMWNIVVRRDVAKQLSALERAEREEELRVRKERRERAEMTAAHTAALAAQANGLAAAAAADAGGDEAEGNAKKKRKKDGPGVTARNMSEDVRKKMSNAVATQAAGLGGKYSWMTAANASTPPPKPKPAASTPAPAAANSPASTTAAAATPAAAATSATSSWARPYVSSKKTQSNSQKDNAADDDSRTSVTMRDAMFVIEKERGHGGGRGAARGWV